MKVKESVAHTWCDQAKHEWQCSDGNSLFPVRLNAFLAGFEKAREMATIKFSTLFNPTPGLRKVSLEDFENLGEEEAS